MPVTVVPPLLTISFVSLQVPHRPRQRTSTTALLFGSGQYGLARDPFFRLRTVTVLHCVTDFDKSLREFAGSGVGIRGVAKRVIVFRVARRIFGALGFRLYCFVFQFRASEFEASRFFSGWNSDEVYSVEGGASVFVSRGTSSVPLAFDFTVSSLGLGRWNSRRAGFSVWTSDGAYSLEGGASFLVSRGPFPLLLGFGFTVSSFSLGCWDSSGGQFRCFGIQTSQFCADVRRRIDFHSEVRTILGRSSRQTSFSEFAEAIIFWWL